MLDAAWKVSPDAAVAVICPEPFDVVTNCLRTVNEVTEALLFASVFKVLILFFLNLRRRIFLFVSWNVPLNLLIGTVVTAVAELSARTIVVSFVRVATLEVKSAPPAPAPTTVTKSPTFREDAKFVPKPVTFALEPFIDALPSRVTIVFSAISAVKSSSAEVASSILTCLTWSNVLGIIEDTVNVLLLVSLTRPSLSLDDVDIKLSVVKKVPTTFVSSKIAF